MEEEFIDKDLGKVCIKRNIRAKNIIARKRIDFIQLTAPSHTSIKEILAALEQMKPRLQQLKVRPKLILDTETVFKTMSFSLKIETQSVRNFHTRLEGGILHIVCPDIYDFQNDLVQNTLRNTIEQVMRSEAKRIFPSKLQALAEMYGFEYNGLSINKSKTRWGSCSSKKNINLSYFCLFLPEYLIDFVMLHELCHTKEMNHGKNFWLLLDKVSSGKAKQLTEELKKSAVMWW